MMISWVTLARRSYHSTAVGRMTETEADYEELC